MKIIKIFFYFFIFAPIGVSYADLTFDSYKIEKTLDRNTEEFPFYFSFENNGTRPIKILNITTSCGCTVVDCDKKIYLPKEKGKLYGKFITGNLTGVQEKYIDVQTDSIASPSITLQIKFNLPLSITIKPAILVWRFQSPANNKNINIKIEQNSGLKFKKIEYDSKIFSVTTTALSDFDYTLKVTPLLTNKKWYSTLKIICTDDNKDKTYLAHLLCK